MFVFSFVVLTGYESVIESYAVQRKKLCLPVLETVGREKPYRQNSRYL